MQELEFKSFEKVVTGGYSPGYIHLSLNSDAIRYKKVFELASFIYDKIKSLNTNFNPNAFTLCSLSTSVDKVGIEDCKSVFSYKMLSCFFILKDKENTNCSKNWFKHDNVCLYGTDEKITRLEIAITFTELKYFGFSSLSIQQLRTLYVVLGITIKNLSKFKPLSYSNRLGFNLIQNQPLANLLKNFPANTWFINKHIHNTCLFCLSEDNSYLYALGGYREEVLLPYIQKGLLEFVQCLNNSSFEDKGPVNLIVLLIVKSLFPNLELLDIDKDLQYYKQVLLDNLDIEVSKVLLARNSDIRFLISDKSLDDAILEFFNTDKIED